MEIKKQAAVKQNRFDPHKLYEQNLILKLKHK